MQARLFDGSVLGTPQEAMDFVTNILESSTEYSIIGEDLNGDIILWNEGARRLYGYEPEEVIGKANSAILHTPEDVVAGRPGELLHAALRDGKWEGTLQRYRKTGERFAARVVITPRRDPAGRPIGFLLISKSITEHARLQIQLAELENANLAKDRFLSHISHELRTPLNAIIGFTGTLLMKIAGPLTPDQQKQLKTIQSSGRHLLSLINDLLDLAKIEAGKMDLTFEPVICQSVIEEVTTALRPFAEAKGLKFDVRVPEENLVVPTDRRALEQILINLTNNAIKFTERGEICLEVSRRRDNGRHLTEISVTDTGIGIRPEDQTKLFQAFEQIHTQSPRHYEGTGLGLHLSQKLSILLGADITFQSQPGKGSRFSLVIPEKPELPGSGHAASRQT
jgi:PAS domain S-box-containing protein